MLVHYTLQGTEATLQREPIFTGEPVNSSHTQNTEINLLLWSSRFQSTSAITTTQHLSEVCINQPKLTLLRQTSLSNNHLQRSWSSSSSSYLHGLQISVDLHCNHLLVPGGCQVSLDVQMQVDWFQQLGGWTGCLIHTSPGSSGEPQKHVTAFTKPGCDIM